MHLGYANGGLIQRKFPDLCHAVAQKLEDCKKRRFVALRQAVAGASLEAPPPTLHSLSLRLGFQNSSTLRLWFRDETDRVLAARVRHAQLETAKLRAALFAILRAEPAPSLCSVAHQLCLSVSEFGGGVSRPLSGNTVAVPAVPERADARARAVAERRGVPDHAGSPRKGADSDGTPYYALTEQGFAQTMGSRATRSQEGQAITESRIIQ